MVVDKGTAKTYLRKTYPDRVLKWVDDAKWSGPAEVALENIKMDRRPGGREMDKVKGIAQAFKDNKAMEPVVLVKNDGKYKVADGYHRTLGAKHAGKTTIKAIVGEVEDMKGPWDKEMHDAKLNVGKAAFEHNSFFSKVAEESEVKPLTDSEIEVKRVNAETEAKGGEAPVTSMQGYDNLEKDASFADKAMFFKEKAVQLRNQH